jgi:hypothetical protein
LLHDAVLREVVGRGSAYPQHEAELRRKLREKYRRLRRRGCSM